MFVAISVERHCMYCAAAHVACCRMLEVNPDWVAAAEQNNLERISDPKLRTMIAFAVKCARSPQTLRPAD
jgi:AhpD family alkylhydroperoxidase